MHPPRPPAAESKSTAGDAWSPERIAFMRGRHCGLGIAFAALVTVAAAVPAEAQYFGRNKVQYKSLDFEVLKTEHFDIYFYPQEKEAITIAAQMAERWYVRLADLFGHELTGRQPLIIYASHTDFRQTNAVGGEIGEGTGGVNEVFMSSIVLPFGMTIGLRSEGIQ